MEIVKPCLKNLANLYYFQGLDDEGMAEPEGDEPMAEEPSMGDMWVEVKKSQKKVCIKTNLLFNLEHCVQSPYGLRPCSSGPYCI